MDPNQYHNPGAGYAEDDPAGYDDFNNTLLMHPETIMDEAWYTGFDYSGAPADPAWDAAAAQAYEDGPFYDEDDEDDCDEGGGGAPSSSKSGGKEHKGKGKDKDKGKSKSKSKSGSGSKGKEPEYRFKSDLPAAADWDEHREAIRELYLTQKLSLRDVVEAMKENYAFVATERMYKHQFKKWNWTKYKAKDRK